MRKKEKNPRDLHTLLVEDLPLRAYFLSFPVSVQMTAHRANDELHTAEEVRAYLARMTHRFPEK